MENKNLVMGIVIGMFLFVGAFLLLNNSKEEKGTLNIENLKGVKSNVGEEGTILYGKDWETNYLKDNKSINITGVSNVLDDGVYKPFSEVYKIGRDGRFIKIIGSDFNVTLDWGIVQTNGVRRDSEWILTNYPAVKNKLNQKILRNLVTWNMNINVSTLPQVVKDNVAGFYFELEGTEGNITYNDVQRIERQGEGYTYYVLVIKDAVLNFENPAKAGIDVTINKTTITYNDIRSAVVNGNIEIGNTFEHLNKDSLEPIKAKFIGYEKGMDVELRKDNLNLYKWDREVGFGINLGNNYEGLSWENGTFRNKYEDYEIVQYPKLNNQFEFEIILDSAPQNNWIEFDINTEGLKFLYQAPLNEENHDENLTCTATECINEEGKVVTYRPENMVDSYAVYSEDLQNNKYATGKVLHIERVWMNDSLGNFSWIDRFIINKTNETSGKMRMELPPTYLDNALYPVTIDPIFGYTISGSTSRDMQNVVLYANVGANVSSNGTLFSANVEVGSASVGEFFRVGIYTNAGGTTLPVDLIANANSTTESDLGGGWYYEIPINGTVVTGIDYIIAVMAGDFSINLQADTDASFTHWKSISSDWDDFTNPIVTAPAPRLKTDHFRFSVFYNYTENTINEEDCGCIDYQNWEENLSESCTMNVDCSPYNITYIETGTFTCDAFLNATSFPELLANQHEKYGSSCVEVLN